MRVTTKENKAVNIFKKNTCLACDLGIPHKIKQSEWCTVKTKTR